MKPTYYFDDPEEGLSRETSHPQFLELATDDFYYDCCDDFSPFGNDDGADTLYCLQDWYQDGGQNSEGMQFLTDLLGNWDLGVPDHLIPSDPVAVESWLSEEKMHETYLLSECRARVATAFGQLKITGNIDPQILNEGLSAISFQLWLNERAQKIHPDWKYADENQSKLMKLQAVFLKLQR
jgi:uncharacterized protein YfeS